MRTFRAITATAGAAVLFAALGYAAMPAAQADRLGTEVVEYQVFDGVARGQALADAGLDVVSKREGGDLFVVGDEGTGVELGRLGFRSKVSKRFFQEGWEAPTGAANAADETFYGGYHTVNAHYANMDNAAKNHADLATVVTYGQSWRKQQGKGGYDLRAICVTKKQAGDCAVKENSAKPKFLLQTQIHSREIATGEMSYKYINYLVDGYGKDQAVTKLLDTTEIWIIPIVNPDGVERVQAGGNNPVMHRKNANFTDADLRQCGDTISSQPGVDLNRNFGYQWRSETSKCSQTTSTSTGSAESEPETKATEKLWLDLFGDHRADGSTAKADPATRGTALSLHSYASVIIMPWMYTDAHSPDDAKLRAIAKEMSTFSGYKYGQAGEVLYNVNGGSDDYAYGKLGMASYTIELGDTNGSCDGFAPKYSCVDSKFWPAMVKTFNYLAGKAPAPYK